MAVAADIVGRDSFCGPGFTLNGNVCVRGGWFRWGRWILAGIVLFIALLIVAALIVIRRRRARRGGMRPTGGPMGWLGGGSSSKPPPPPPQQTYPYADPNQQYYYGGGGGAGGYSTYPAPPYGAPPVGEHVTGETFGPNDGYYAGQQYGVQAPPNAYQQQQPYPPMK